MGRKRERDLDVLEEEAWRLLRGFFVREGLSVFECMMVVKGLLQRFELERVDLLKNLKFEIGE